MKKVSLDWYDHNKHQVDQAVRYEDRRHKPKEQRPSQEVNAERLRRYEEKVKQGKTDQVNPKTEAKIHKYAILEARKKPLRKTSTWKLGKSPGSYR